MIFIDQILEHIATFEEKVSCKLLASGSQIVKEHDLTAVLELGEQLEGLFVAH